MSNDARNALGAIQALIVKDLEDASDADIRAEIIEDGQDPDLLARELAEGLDATVSDFLRGRVAATKAVRSSARAPAPTARPALAKIKELVQQAFASEPSLASAYRQGTKQSEADWISTYDDLVLLEKIKPESDD